MSSVAEAKTYELAYHVTPDIEEGGLAGMVSEIESLIAQNGGSVLFSHAPRLRPLSYPVKHRRQAFFGVLDFTVPAEALEKINSQIKLQNGVMRFLITKKPEVKGELRVLGASKPRMKLKTHEPVKEIKPKQEVEPGQLEKEIEEVLEKI